MEIKKNDQTIGLYEAYGLRFIGKTGVYHSNIFNEDHDVITHIAVVNTETNETIYSSVLYNNFIYMDVFARCCESVLFYFSHNTLDSYSINKTINDVLIHNNGSLFCHRMKQLIEKEQADNARIKEVEQYVSEYQEVENYCTEHDYTLFEGVHNTYVLTFNNKVDIEKFNHMEDKTKQLAIDKYASELGINIITSIETNLGMYKDVWYRCGMSDLLEQIKYKTQQSNSNTQIQPINHVTD